eukprot:scaffold80101_cov63-Phaeocystis_antarctica.AAC.3
MAQGQKVGRERSGGTCGGKSDVPATTAPNAPVQQRLLTYVPGERGLLARAEGGGVGAVDHGKGRTERRHRGQSGALGVLAAAHLLAAGLAVAVALARLLAVGWVRRAEAARQFARRACLLALPTATLQLRARRRLSAEVLLTLLYTALVAAFLSRHFLPASETARVARHSSSSSGRTIMPVPWWNGTRERLTDASGGCEAGAFARDCRGHLTLAVTKALVRRTLVLLHGIL